MKMSQMSITQFNVQNLNSCKSYYVQKDSI